MTPSCHEAVALLFFMLLIGIDAFCGERAGLRPDARAALGGFHGLLRKRRGLLPLLLLGEKRILEAAAAAATVLENAM